MNPDEVGPGSPAEPDLADAGAEAEAEAVTLRVLVDDVRDFKDGRAAVVLRTSGDAVAYVQGLNGRRVDELWLDHDLVGEDTVQPLVDLLVADAAHGQPLRVGRIWVHSSNIREGHRVVQELAAAGYPVQRSYAANLWRHSRCAPTGVGSPVAHVFEHQRQELGSPDTPGQSSPNTCGRQ